MAKKHLERKNRQPIDKTLNLEQSVPNPLDQKIRFRFDQLDISNRWCFGGISNQDLHDLLIKLKSFETRTVKEVFFSGDKSGKSYELNALIPDAQRRLEVIKQDDMERIHRLRFSNLKRLYGKLVKNEFSIIWWDPEHEICPSPLKNS